MRKPLIALSFAIFLAMLPSGCMFDQFSEEKREDTFGSVGTNLEQDMRFKAYLGRLRKAVALRDYEAMRQMMTDNFGFDLGTQYEGPFNAFDYWQQHDLWFQLEQTLAQGFDRKGYFLVAPAEFARAEGDFPGFRAGITDTRNGYRFAYFVDDTARPFTPSSVNDAPQAGMPGALQTGPQVGTAPPGNNPVVSPSYTQPGPFTDAQMLEP